MSLEKASEIARRVLGEQIQTYEANVETRKKDLDAAQRAYEEAVSTLEGLRRMVGDSDARLIDLDGIPDDWEFVAKPQRARTFEIDAASGRVIRALYDAYENGSKLTTAELKIVAAQAGSKADSVSNTLTDIYRVGWIAREFVQGDARRWVLTALGVEECRKAFASTLPAAGEENGLAAAPQTSSDFSLRAQKR